MSTDGTVKVRHADLAAASSVQKAEHWSISALLDWTQHWRLSYVLFSLGVGCSELQVHADFSHERASGEEHVAPTTSSGSARHLVTSLSYGYLRSLNLLQTFTPQGCILSVIALSYSFRWPSMIVFFCPKVRGYLDECVCVSTDGWALSAVANGAVHECSPLTRLTMTMARFHSLLVAGEDEGRRDRVI